MDTTKTLDQSVIVSAATNSPALATDSFTLGDKYFKIIDLAYDDYMAFLLKLQPMLEVFAGQLTGRADLVSPTKLDLAALVKYCAASLPDMVCIICQQTDPSMTVAEVKQVGRSPFKLAAIVMAQINRNKMIEDITDFFTQILPLMPKGKG